jgi:preprotein translocase subunit YajC
MILSCMSMLALPMALPPLERTPLTGAVLALGGSPQGGEAHPMASLVLMGLIFAIFYFVLIMPMRNKQKKLEQLITELKSGDKVIINPGIFGTIEAVEDNTFHVRIAEKTRIKVLKSAVTGLQEAPSETEKN